MPSEHTVPNRQRARTHPRQRDVCARRRVEECTLVRHPANRADTQFVAARPGGYIDYIAPATDVGQRACRGTGDYAGLVEQLDIRQQLRLLAAKISEERRVGQEVVRKCRYRWL